MAVAFVQATASTFTPTTITGTTGTITPSLPVAGTSANTIVAAVYVDAGGGTTPGITLPGSWNVGPTRSVTTGNANPSLLSLFWRTGFTGTSQAFTCTVGASTTYYLAAAMLELSGTDLSNPFHLSGFNDQVVAGTASYNGPNLTPTIPSTFAFSVFATNDDFGDNFAAATGWTLRHATTGASGVYAQLCVQTYNSNPATSGSALQSAVTAGAFNDNASCTLTGGEFFIQVPAAAGGRVVLPNLEGGMQAPLYTGGMTG